MTIDHDVYEIEHKLSLDDNDDDWSIILICFVAVEFNSRLDKFAYLDVLENKRDKKQIRDIVRELIKS